MLFTKYFWKQEQQDEAILYLIVSLTIQVKRLSHSQVFGQNGEIKLYAQIPTQGLLRQEVDIAQGCFAKILTGSAMKSPEEMIHMIVS